MPDGWRPGSKRRKSPLPSRPCFLSTPPAARKPFRFRDRPRQQRVDLVARIYSKLCWRYRFEPFPGRLLIVEATEDALVREAAVAMRNSGSVLRLFFSSALRKVGCDSLAQKIAGPALGQLEMSFRSARHFLAAANALLGATATVPVWETLGGNVTVKQVPGGHGSVLGAHAATLAECLRKHLSPPEIEETASQRLEPRSVVTPEDGG